MSCEVLPAMGVFFLCYNTNMTNDKKQTYWFKRRRYGYGWTPVTWQGWLAVVVFLAIVLSSASILEAAERNTYSSDMLLYYALIAVAVLLLLAISFIKGPSPKWRWGSKTTDNPDEDI